MNNEKLYLDKASELFSEYEQRILALKGETGAVNRQVIVLLKKVIEEEGKLRKVYDIDVRFSVIQKQLHKLLEECEREAGFKNTALEKETKKDLGKLAADEAVVYVYVFNAQGNKLKTWQNLLNPHALMEHSVNRPIYSNKRDIEEVMRAKANTVQHGYIEVVVKTQNILESLEKSHLRDQYGHALLRLRQGALMSENIRCFYHESKQYKVSDEGMLLI